jgi:Spy/CpxP family protein refolding chaperone
MGGPGGDASPIDRMTEALKKLDLSSEQKEKIEALKKQYEPKFKAIREKREKILTAEQKKAMQAGFKKAAEASGEDRREAFRKVMEAVKITPEQREKMGAVGQEVRALLEELRPKMAEILTEKQREQLQKAMPPRGPRGDRGPRNESAPKERKKEST